MTPTPRYQIINQDLTAQITSGALKRGERLASEADLAQHYGVSRMTLRQALGQLEAEGLVVRRHGTGTFVADERPIRRRGNTLGPFHEQLGVPEEDLATRVLYKDVVQAPEEVTRSLGLGSRQRVVNVQRVRLLDEKPIAFQESWIPYLLAPALIREDLVRGSLYLTLARYGIEVAWAEQQVSATILASEDAARLGVPAGSPALRLRRIAYMEDQTPIEVARSYTLPQVPLEFRLDR